MIEELVEHIWHRKEFHKEYHDLILANLRQALPNHFCQWDETLSPHDEPPSLECLRRLLQSAAHFAASRRVDCREAGYRIAVASWNLFNRDGDIQENLRQFIHLVLGRLGNFPAISFLYRGNDGIQSTKNLPTPAWLALRSHELLNKVQVAGMDPLILTDFQRGLWDRLESGMPASISAPTSAGKSYVLEHFLASTTRSGSGRWAVYIVPTRALINQVSADLLDTASHFDQGGLSVVTIPSPPSELGIEDGIYVLTQERLQLLFDADPTLRFDLAVIDEAQMIAEPARGVILQSVVEEILHRSPVTQLLFAAPLARDEGAFGKIFDIKVDPVPRPERPVAQNLIFLDTDYVLRNRVNVGVLLERHRHHLGSLILSKDLYDEDQALAMLSFLIGSGEKNLVYAGGKARCEKIADALRQLVETEVVMGPLHSETAQKKLNEFSEFVKQHVHPDYALATVIPHGIAFHYGNMPALIRRTVEEMFRSGYLTHLVCTSTLLHGMNLPAKNLFLVNPTKGRDWDTSENIPISALDFWNLAGRAGRLGKEFEGNVFLIDYSRWKVQPVSEETEQIVQSSLEFTLVERMPEFLEFVRNSSHASGVNEQAENAFVKLVNAERSCRLHEILNRAVSLSEESRQEISEAIREAAQRIDVPPAITQKNITISVFRQQQMLDYLTKRILQKGPRYVIPVHPAGVWDEALKSLSATLRRIHIHFELRKTKAENFYAPLALKWMKGTTLPILIEDAIKYKRKKSPGAKTATIIRDTLNDIETQLRFRYVKYTSCYHDLLIEALTRTNHSEFIEKVPPLALYLELGASSGTMISLVGLGLSRTTAGEVSRKTPNLSLDRPSARRWLGSQPWASMDISPICVREIERILANPN